MRTSSVAAKHVITTPLDDHGQSEMFVKVTESTSNVPFISNVIQSSWGDKYMLVSNDGLEIQDSSGTQVN